jgi:hypothetical protein
MSNADKKAEAMRTAGVSATDEDEDDEDEDAQPESPDDDDGTSWKFPLICRRTEGRG